MRDIRDDLRERLKAIESERRHLEFQFKELESREKRLNVLLEEENARYEDRQLFAPPTIHEGMSDLSRFLLHIMKRQHDWPLGVLAKEATDQGLLDRKGSPGRQVHGALVGLMQRGFVERNEHSNWQLVKSNTPTTKAVGVSDSSGAA